MPGVVLEGTSSSVPTAAVEGAGICIYPKTCRQRFHSTDVEPGEIPKDLYVGLKELYGKWNQPKGKTVTYVGEMIIYEQYLQMLSPELQVWIREHEHFLQRLIRRLMC